MNTESIETDNVASSIPLNEPSTLTSIGEPINETISVLSTIDAVPPIKLTSKLI